MAYIYPLTFDPLNLCGKHDVADELKSEDSSASKTLGICSWIISLEQLRLLFVALDSHIKSFENLPWAKLLPSVKQYVVNLVSEYNDLRDVIVQIMEELK